ncbi:MAG: DUF302 domain-containing protein [Cyclobacteriaceae bacterium]|nr:DUF302 domain-containing protein [Cyclobacteriaceae bacterium]
MSYFHSITVKSPSIEQLREKVEGALKSEGFGVLTEIDVQATMKKKLDKDYAPYLILGACNPVFADKVLSAEPHIGVLLPCNVTIRQLDAGNFEVAMMNPGAAMSAVQNPAIEPLANEVGEKLQRALDLIEA